MRRIVVHMQSTLNGRIADVGGGFWEPFPWGEPEMAYLNRFLAEADTWVMSRVMYEAIVPWWEETLHEAPTDQEFAAILASMTKIVFSQTMSPAPGRTIIKGDIAEALASLKRQLGKDILLSCGPGTLAPLADTPGLIDEYLIAVHPVAISAGPRLFDGLSTDLALKLVEAKAFEAGCLLLRYASTSSASTIV